MTRDRELLLRALGLLAEAESSMGAPWREQVQRLADELRVGPDARSPLDERLDKVEGALTQLAFAVLNIQNTLLQATVVGSPAPRSRWQEAQDIDPEGEVELVGGEKIKLKDVPIDPKTGQPDEEWAMAHCPCETHEEKRKAKAGNGEPPPTRTGQYL